MRLLMGKRARTERLALDLIYHFAIIIYGSFVNRNSLKSKKHECSGNVILIKYIRKLGALQI